MKKPETNNGRGFTEADAERKRKIIQVAAAAHMDYGETLYLLREGKK